MCDMKNVSVIVEGTRPKVTPKVPGRSRGRPFGSLGRKKRIMMTQATSSSDSSPLDNEGQEEGENSLILIDCLVHKLALY